MNQIVKAFCIALVLAAGAPFVSSVQAQASTTNSPAPGTLTPEKVRWVLDCCQTDMFIQLGATRNDLKIAYESGKLTIVPEVKTQFVLYDVSFGGITLCIVETI